MTSCRRIQAPRRDGVETLTFVANARKKRSFNTILDAQNLFDRDGRSTVTTRVHRDGGERRVVRFEGPYGPPGAPEVVLELAP